MFLTVHGAAGVLIGLQTGNPFLAFILGLLAHYFFDAIPHGDEKMIADHYNVTREEIKKMVRIAIGDGLILLLFLFILYYRGKIPASWPVLAGVIGGILPDFLNGFYYLLKFKWLKFHYDFHLWIHGVLDKFAVSFKTGLVIQAAILAILVWWII